MGHKLQALILVCIVMFSLQFPVAPVGIAAAGNVERPFGSDATHYSGVEYGIDAGASHANEVWTLNYAVDNLDGAQLGGQLATISLDSDGQGTVSTSIPDGDDVVVVTANGEVAEFDTTDGTISSFVDASDATAVSAAAEIVEQQSLSLSLGSVTVADGGNTQEISLSVLSNWTGTTVELGSSEYSVINGTTISDSTTLDLQSVPDTPFEIVAEDTMTGKTTRMTINKTSIRQSQSFSYSYGGLPSEPTEQLTGGRAYWQGTNIEFDGFDAGVTYELRELDGTTGSFEIGSFVREIRLNSTGGAEFDTANLNGEYTVVDENGNEINRRFVINTPSIRFNRSRVSIGGTNGDGHITIYSNRDRFDLTVWADELSRSTVNDAIAIANRDGDDLLIEDVSSTDTITIDESQVPDGSYTFRFAVPSGSSGGLITVHVTDGLNKGPSDDGGTVDTSDDTSVSAETTTPDLTPQPTTVPPISGTAPESTATDTQSTRVSLTPSPESGTSTVLSASSETPDDTQTATQRQTQTAPQTPSETRTGMTTASGDGFGAIIVLAATALLSVVALWRRK